MARTRTMRAPDGRRVRATERIERIKGRYRVMVRYLDDDGNVVDPCDLVRDEPIKSRAHSRGSARSRGASKAKKVKSLTSDRIDEGRSAKEAIQILSEEDRERIVERVKSKPRKGRPGVSARDVRDLEEAGKSIEERNRKAAMRIAAEAMKIARR